MSKSLKDEFPTISEIAYRDYMKHSHVSDVMTSTVLTINPEDSMMQAAKIMGERHIGSVIVTEKETPTGRLCEKLWSKGIMTNYNTSGIYAAKHRAVATRPALSSVCFFGAE